MNRKIVAIWLSLIIMFGFVVIIVDIAPIVEAPTTLYVGGSNPGNYSKIQWAINNASDGDTVFVYNGTYYECIWVNRTINLIGEDEDITIIDGCGLDDVVTITSNCVNLTGFNIKNCSSGFTKAGLVLNSVQNCSVFDNHISSNNYDGINLYDSHNNRITNNTVQANSRRGIFLQSSSGNNISYNNVFTHSNSILLSTSSDNVLYANNIWNSGIGIRISSSPNNRIIGNNFIKNGIQVQGYQLSDYNSHYIPTDNLVNGKPVYYYVNLSGMDIDSIEVGQIILANCTNFNISNLDINYTDLGVQLAYSSDININKNNFSYIHSVAILSAYQTSGINITNNFMDHVNYGARFEYSLNNEVSSNNFIDCGYPIDVVWSSSNVLIKNNNVTSCSYAINIGSAYSNSIFNNKFHDNYVGTWIRSVSRYNVVENNTYSLNDEGIRLDSSQHNRIENNNISNSIKYGIILDNAENITIENNNISSNEQGLWLSSSSDNNITKNNVILNNNKGIWLLRSNDNNINNNNVSSNMVGIYLDSSQNNSITDNNCSFNICESIYFYKANSNSLINNKISNNSNGIYFYRSSNNNLTFNKITSNEQYGFWFDISSNHNIITHNNFTSNNLSGIFLRNSKYNSISNNSFNLNLQDGLTLYFSDRNFIFNNTLVDIKNSAINLNNSCKNVLSHNTISKNKNGIVLTKNPDFIFTGEGAGDEFGWSVSGAGDVNNDDFDDIIVGARSNDAGGSDAGRAYIYSGLTGELIHAFTGETAGCKLGQSVSGIGDINKDGFDDVIVGAHGTNGWRGRAYVYSGQTGEVLYTFDGEATSDYFGIYVSGAGDVNNDSYLDVIVGASDNSAGGSNAGRAYVYSGQNGSILYTFTGEAADDNFGFSVSGAGDVNNDGFDDVIVGAHLNDAGGSNAGQAYVFSGFNGSLLYNFTGETSDDYFGSRVSNAGDVNNDGFDDVIVGAHGAVSWSGKAYIYSGQNGQLIRDFTGEEEWDWLGFAVSGCGDLNSDGFDDVIIGAHFKDVVTPNVGRVYVYLCPAGTLLYTFDGEATDDRFGTSVSGVSDVNNDGFNDFIIGAYFNDVGGENAGRAYVYSSYPQGSNNNIIMDNSILNNTDYGVFISSSINNIIYHNTIINNTNQAYDNTNNQNLWDNGYPSGGNYWSDYTGLDNFKGPHQNITGSDGIGDTNYSIDMDSIDHYPLMEPYYYKPFENYTILKQGWNLISIPLIQVNENPYDVLEMIDGYYDAVQWYDIMDPADPWEHHKVGKTFGNDLFKLNETMSFWIHITNPGDTIFVYNGTPPTSNQTIQLHPGWNMVGYPSLSNHNRTVGLNNLTFGIDVDAVQWYDAATKTWHDMGPDDLFVPGRGYWVHVNVECEWEVPL